MLRTGQRAPDFVGVDQNGNTVSLDDLVKDAIVVLYFYPKDFTAVCTQEACLFRDAYENLRGRGATIVGVSLDGQATHARFANKHGLPFRLLADPDKKISRAYDALQLFGFFTKRVTYVIDRNKMIRGVFHHELSATKHLADVEGALVQKGLGVRG